MKVELFLEMPFNELNYDAMGMSSTQQMSIRGLKRKQKICEIIGNEGKRIGGKKKNETFVYWFRIKFSNN